MTRIPAEKGVNERDASECSGPVIDIVHNVEPNLESDRRTRSFKNESYPTSTRPQIEGPSISRKK